MPLKGNLVTALNLNSLSSSSVVNVASYVSGGNIFKRVVVKRGLDVTSGAVSKALVNIVNKDGVDGSVGSGQTGTSSYCKKSKRSYFKDLDLN